MNPKFKFLIICSLVLLLLIIVIINVIMLLREASFEDVSIAKRVYFYHYNRYRFEDPIELKTDGLFYNDINMTLPWKFFIHGWTTSPQTSPWFYLAKLAYLETNDYNIVFVDWSKPANQTYMKSVKNAMLSGAHFGMFLMYLNHYGVPFDKIHLLGHSLGAQMAGFAGKYVAATANNKIQRITGLDPAGPFYESPTNFDKMLMKNDENRKYYMEFVTGYDLNIEKYILPDHLRLSKLDARFVDVIHTDAPHYGMMHSIGHVDFYPNGGKPFQPGCENTNDDNCSHARSVYFFVESINSNTFVAKKCTSFEDYDRGLCDNNEQAHMGEHVNHTTRGNFYLKTNPSAPYGQG